MSTKDISRSALEGGRANRNQYDRNESHRHERSRARAWLDQARFDFDVVEASVPRARGKVSKEFTDKLNPCYRWLASRVGKPWSKVYSELTGAFDTRKLSAWHIVHQHMLTNVHGAGTSADGSTWHSPRFYIDALGILRDRGRHWRSARDHDSFQEARDRATAKAAGRRVADYGRCQRWMELSENSWTSCLRPKHCTQNLEHRVIDLTPSAIVEMYTSGSHRSFRDSPHWRVLQTEHLAPAWRAGRRFTKEESAWWATLPRWLQQSFLRT